MTKGVADHSRHDVALTQTQIEAIELAIQGKSVMEIAKSLHIGCAAVRMRFSRACDRLGALNRMQMGAIYERMRK